MAKTYDPIATYTVPSSTASYTFSSIPGTYTDLILEGTIRTTATEAHADMYMRFNGDTGTNYSGTAFWGNGTSAGTSQELNASQIRPGYWISNANEASLIYTPFTLSIMDYSNSIKNKVCLATVGSITLPNFGVKYWRSTAAVTSITILMQFGNLAAGSTFTLYGVKSA